MTEIVVYTTKTCRYCHAAKALLERHQLDYREVDLSGDAEATMALMARTKQRTVPQIFVADEFVGGYEQLAARLASTAA